ncbi:MAG: hypothetical protein FVQ83_07955 [Chloroflexi bacterium]|nr:hypothetical protein [Chloroflexota bacterium]
MRNWKTYFPLVGALLLAAGLKTWLTISASVPFNGDEAVVSLMARHILDGFRPVFFYGQAYMGSLDAWLVALGFRLFGESVAAVRIVQSCLYLLYIISIWGLARRLFTNKLIANLSVFLAAIPPVVVTTYTTATLGGYGESLVLGNLILLLGYEVTFGDKQDKWWTWLALGLVGGISFWTLGIAGVYLLPIGLIGLWKFNQKLIAYYILAGIGFFLGAAPWWLYNINNSWAALQALSGPELIQTSIFNRAISFLFLGLPALLSLRVPWSPNFIVWPLLLLGMWMYFAVATYSLGLSKAEKTGKNPGASILLNVFGLAFLGVFIFTRFGIDATGRYLIPLYLLVVYYSANFIAAFWKTKKGIAIGLLAAFLILNGAGTWLAAISVDKITTQFDPITSFDNSYDETLIDFLEQSGETTGYSNYWVSFRLAFLSQEQIVFSPELPYKEDMSYTPNDNRYLPYAQTADSSAQVAYITTKHPELDAYIREHFDELGISYQEHQIGEFHIFYALSRAVRPEEIGYGSAYR